MSNKILVVDDDPLICKTLSKVLVNAGYDVVTASTAEEALKALNKEHIRVCFLDLKLPTMNGMKLCREIKDKNPLDCVYALTGFATEFDIEECRKAGFDDYFIKPFKVDLMLKAVATAFEKLKRWQDIQDQKA